MSKFILVAKRRPKVDRRLEGTAVGWLAVNAENEGILAPWTTLVSPRVVSEDVAWPQMSEETKEPPKFLRVTEFLQMDTRSYGGATRG